MQVRDPSAPVVPTAAQGSCSMLSSLGKGVLQNPETPSGTLAAPLRSRTPGSARGEQVSDPWAEPQGPRAQTESEGIGIREAGPTRAREQSGLGWQ